MNFFQTNFEVNIHRLTKQEISNFSINNGRILVESDISLFGRCKGVIEADPFIIKKSNQYFVFYEDLEDYFGKAVLKMKYSNDLITWSEPKTILKEPFHLSFPFIFKDKNDFYMLPETIGDNSIRLYKACSDTLDEWKLCKKLIQNKKYSDSFIIQHNGIYYLFTTKEKDNPQKDVFEQHLYYSSNLEGPYTLHPKSPICASNKYARNGGAMILIDGEMYRPVQDCNIQYGGQLHIMKVLKLSETEYEEELYKENVLQRTGHHLSIAPGFNSSEIIACTDSKIHNYNLQLFFKRLLNFIRNK